MREITTEELQKKINNGENFRLVMTYRHQAFLAKHIPGSINIDSSEAIEGQLHPDDEIIVYCVNEGCQASVYAYRQLVQQGFRNVRRYSEGLEGWEAAGLDSISG